MSLRRKKLIAGTAGMPFLKLLSRPGHDSRPTIKYYPFVLSLFLFFYISSAVAATGIATITGLPEQGQTLTANLSDADGITTSSPTYQWKRNSSDIGGATLSTYGLTQDDVNSSITVTIDYIDDLLNNEVVTSAATDPISNINDEPQGQPVITGTIKEGELLGVNTSGITDLDGGVSGFTYVWKSGGATVGTGSTYTPVQSDVGNTLTVEVSYNDAGGTDETVISNPTVAVLDINNVPQGQPVIGGTAKQDEVLTADVSGISDSDGLGSFSYLWKRDSNPISGANSSTYTLLQADVSTRISVTVSYVDGGGKSESLTSTETVPVVNTNDEPVGVPVITGIAKQGEVLTANALGISDADGLGSFSYQWNRGGIAINGATATTYTLVQADVNTLISVTVSYVDGGGASESRTSLETVAIVNTNDEPVGVPVIVGSAEQGEVLTVDVSGISDVDGLGVFSYQWKRGIDPIFGATDSTYTLVQADVNAQISVAVSYVDGGGVLESQISVATAVVVNVNDPSVGVPVIVSSSLSQGGILSVDVSGISDADGLGGFSYLWKSSGTDVSTGSTYQLQQSDVGNTLNVTVSFVDGGGTSESQTSIDTDIVTNTNDDPVGKPVISGIVEQGQVLTADASGISDADGLGVLSYQWLRSGGVIVDAIAASYTLVQDDVGAFISVRVSYTDGGDTAESVESEATVAVVNVNDLPQGELTISGSAIEDQVLTADASTITDADGLGVLNYQWLRGGEIIVGATTSIYTLLQEDVGALISVQVSYTDGGGSAEVVVSAESAAVLNVNDLPGGILTISGSLVQNQVLTVDASTITDADGLGILNYQWLRGGEIIPNAITSAYTLTQEDVGAFISAMVSYTDGQGTIETVTSGSLGPVGNVNDAGVVTIVGAATDGSLISIADITDVDGTDNSTFIYQWLRDGVNIAGETGDTYRIDTGDIGKFISVVVSYVDDLETTETVVSNVIGAIRPDVPNVTAPPDIAPVDATGWFTFVDMDPNSVATAFDTLDDSFITPVPDSNGRFRPGITIVTWSAMDEAGNVGTATQIIRVVPMVDVSKVQMVAEGSIGEFKVSLNGDALQYPVTVPFVVSNSDLGIGSANNDDHDLFSANATISEPVIPGDLPETIITFNVVDDGPGEGTENIIVSLVDAPEHAVFGPNIEHIIEIVEGNVSPVVNLEASQLQLDINSNTVTAFAMATDLNDNDVLNFDWSRSDNSIPGVNNATGGMFSFEPSDLTPGIYTLQVDVDDGQLTATDSLVLRVFEALPELSVTEDTDGDGDPDATDGFGDSDGDGVADYLDAIQASHVVQVLPGVSDEFVMQTEAGLKLSLGDIAIKANSGGSLVEEDDVTNPDLSGNPDADTIENIGGYFDFTISGLPTPGQIVNIVIPQLSAMPRVSVYRKLTASGWQDFVQDSKNIVSSAAGEKGFCPPPGDAAYQAGLTQGHWCLQLTIEDGGPNDDDGEANHRITDPGGVGRILSSVTVSSGGGGGGSFNPLVALISLFVLMALRTKKTYR